jgi:two-component system cell cycle response regulator DivK
LEQICYGLLITQSIGHEEEKEVWWRRQKVQRPTLTQRMGYDVLEAAAGLAAIERASATLPGLITMDLGLPDITGDEATACLKADPSTKHIPVMAITAYYKEAPLVESAVAAGACEVLQNPIALRSLDDALRRLLAVKPNESFSSTKSNNLFNDGPRLTDHT